jgi:DNA modification methylase
MTRREVIGNATLYLGDALQLIPEIAAVDAVLTDPPFGIAYRSGYRTDALWAGDRIINDHDTTTRDAAISLLGDLPMLVFGSWKAPRPAGTRMVLTWDKGPALGMGALDLPWKPSSEEIYVIGSGFVGVRDEGAVIYCPPVQSMAKNGRQHPNEKPVALVERLLRKLPEGRICDPFMGSGTTGVACAKRGLQFVGIEREPRYFEIACRRIEEATRQGDLIRDVLPAKPTQEVMPL